jgi:hypothetical protein
VASFRGTRLPGTGDSHHSAWLYRHSFSIWQYGSPKKTKNPATPMEVTGYLFCCVMDYVLAGAPTPPPNVDRRWALSSFAVFDKFPLFTATDPASSSCRNVTAALSPSI